LGKNFVTNLTKQGRIFFITFCFKSSGFFKILNHVLKVDEKFSHLISECWAIFGTFWSFFKSFLVALRKPRNFFLQHGPDFLPPILCLCLPHLIIMSQTEECQKSSGCGPIFFAFCFFSARDQQLVSDLANYFPFFRGKKGLVRKLMIACRAKLTQNLCPLHPPSFHFRSPRSAPPPPPPPVVCFFGELIVFFRRGVANS
jgi:hypothetical protein